MANQFTMGAALAALLCTGALAVAQDSPPASPAIAGKLAAAKLVEVRGDAAVAEQMLRAALAEAVGTDQALVRRELLTFMKRQGRTIAMGELFGAASAAPSEDPLAELIGRLDRDLMSESVDVCKRELGQLGGLIVPSLLAALPKFGPIGISNALDVLRPLDDPRIGPALVQLALTSDPSVAAAIAARAQGMSAAVALSLARQFAGPEQPLAAQLGALGALIQHESTAPTTRELALRLAAEPTGAVQRQLLVLIEKVQQPWVDEVVQVVRTRGPAAVQGEVLRILIARNPAMTEAEAVRLAGGLPPMQLVSLAQQVARTHPEWVHFGLAGLRAARATGESKLDWGAMAKGWEWWRAPDESGPELLAMPWSTTDQLADIQRALAKLVESGWQVPETSDRQWTQLVVAPHNGQYSGEFWKVFVRALPVAAEDRALAISSQMDPANAASLAYVAVGAERPWHRLIAQQLARSQTSSTVPNQLFDRDWTGAPPEAFAVLEGLTKRWSRNNSGGQLSWHSALIGAFRRSRDLPVSVILPLVEACYMAAWDALVDREPQAALAYARDAAQLGSGLVPRLLQLLAEHGGPADVPLAVRVLAQCESPQSPLALSYLPPFFATHAPGHLEVIRLASLETPVFLQGLRRKVALKAAKEARIVDLEALQAMLPTLHAECARSLAEALHRQIRAEHAAPLARTAEALLARPLVSRPWDGTRPSDDSIPTLGSAEQLAIVLSLLEQTGSTHALPVARLVLANAEAPQYLRGQAARTALAVAGTGRRAVLLGMLLAEDDGVVQVALLDPVLRDDAEVQAARLAAVLRTGARLRATEEVINLFDSAGRIQLAEAVLADARFAEFTNHLAIWAVATIGRRKDPARIAEIQRAGRHPDASVRAEVVKALRSAFSGEAASPLLELLKDEDAGVRNVARSALDELANYLDAKAKWDARLK